MAGPSGGFQGRTELWLSTGRAVYWSDTLGFMSLCLSLAFAFCVCVSLSLSFSLSLSVVLWV